MQVTNDFIPPSITNDDIEWACSALGLPKTAFYGTDGTDPRKAILTSVCELDVEACPGSGKTTLLVAKLAILARKWTEGGRGICVLSHTNVARREIEQRLGNTAAGQQLLSYPHFVGTIHGFANEFLALPWLRSNDMPIRMIDDEIAQSRRWKRIPYKTRIGLERNHINQSILKIKSTSFDLGEIKYGGKPLGHTTPTYIALQEACRSNLSEGYYCHDEMLIFANHLFEEAPEVAQLLRYRFPMLFIDEVQDNSEAQSSLLSKLFKEGEHAVRRQRYGDSNQRIYGVQTDESSAVTDKFPNPFVRADIPNSHRFGRKIAQFARPFGVVPQDLTGQGPPSGITASTEDKHAILLFDESTMKDVLKCFSQYLREVFSNTDIQKGIFTAIGAVHRAGGNENAPRHIGHYWADYDAELTASDPKPKTYSQYLMAGLRRAEIIGETYPLTEFLAEGILSLIRRASPLANVATRQRKHRYLKELLSPEPVAYALYCDLVTSIAAERRIPSPEEWTKKWIVQILQIAETILGSGIPQEVAVEFLKWDTTEDAVLSQKDNRFKDTSGTPQIEIRLGSIHSVKGETHTGTLVCETFFKSHHLATMKRWLLGKAIGGDKQSDLMKSRLRQHYVALTRPTHLLCVAMREDSFTSDEIQTLSQLGWRVGRVTSRGLDWLPV